MADGTNQDVQQVAAERFVRRGEAFWREAAVLYAAVVAQPDEKWGEVPCAFVEPKAGVTPPTEQEIIAFCRQRLAHHKCPRGVIFREVPKTATGKVQKYRLRQEVESREAITRLAEK